MPEQDPTDLPKRRREGFPIVPMKPFVEPQPEQIIDTMPEQKRSTTQRTLHFLGLLALRDRWYEIRDSHRKES